MSDLKVPKRRVAVAATLAGGLRRDVTVFLAEAAPGHAGGERLSDLLNGPHDFIPALEAETGAMTFLNRAALVMAEAGADAERNGADEITIPTEHAVEITLRDGRALRGHVTYVLPPGRSRLADFLNDGSLFLPLHGDSRVRLVHKRHVTRVVLLEE
jgi:hypothetical protein